MAYSDFTLKKLRTEFGISNQKVNLFSSVEDIQPSEELNKRLLFAEKLPLISEKAKSESIIAPVLYEIIQRNNFDVIIHSGEQLNIDKEKGLIGECDFILSKNTNSLDVSYPIFQIVEAKRGDINNGIAQCAAQMIGADLFNKEMKNQSNTVYGCVTSAKEWQFIKLSENSILLHSKTFFIDEIEKILGIFQHIINEFKKEDKQN